MARSHTAHTSPKTFAVDSVLWAIDAVAYDTSMALELVGESRMPDDPDLHQILEWAREEIPRDRHTARVFLRDALKLLRA